MLFRSHPLVDAIVLTCPVWLGGRVAVNGSSVDLRSHCRGRACAAFRNADALCFPLRVQLVWAGSKGTIISKYANLSCRGKTRHNSLIRYPALPGVVARISPGSISFFFSGKSNDRDNPHTVDGGVPLVAFASVFQYPLPRCALPQTSLPRKILPTSPRFRLYFMTPCGGLETVEKPPTMALLRDPQPGKGDNRPPARDAPRRSDCHPLPEPSGRRASAGT